MFRSFAPENLAHNPASQITSQVRTGDAYAWTGHFNQNVTGTANGLNQLTSVGPKTLTHDAKGNVTAFGTKSFTYSSENLLLTGPGSTSLAYDPVMRLQQVASGGATTKFAYDGLDRIAEYDASNALQRRYVHGPGVDDPIVWYEGSGTTDRRFLGSDERGSIISVTDGSGTVLGLNKYDEFGQPQASNLGTFGYTGQAWLASLGLWHYKARAYDPELGRFLQTDPIGYADSPNLYAYVLNDPVSLVDPLGLNREIIVQGWRFYRIDTGGGAGGGMGQAGSGQSAVQLALEMGGEAQSDEPIIVRATRNKSKAKISRLWRDFVRGVRTTVDEAREVACSMFSKLPEGSRIRFGADVLGYGGIGGTAGAGVFIDAGGSLGWDVHYGWGAGFGLIGGIGLGYETSTPPKGRSEIGHLTGAVGAGISGQMNYSKAGGASGTGSAGYGRFGYASGSLDHVTHAGTIGELCD